MNTFDKRWTALRKERKMTQEELAKPLNTSISVIDRYERDAMTTSIDFFNHLNTSDGHLFWKAKKANVFKHSVMQQRLAELGKMENAEKSHILCALNGFIKSVKFKNIAVL
jgi:transcriptional regulator with XRE-family HTH domain